VIENGMSVTLEEGVTKSVQSVFKWLEEQQQLLEGYAVYSKNKQKHC
jgi:hypothetical protein